MTTILVTTLYAHPTLVQTCEYITKWFELINAFAIICMHFMWALKMFTRIISWINCSSSMLMNWNNFVSWSLLCWTIGLSCFVDELKHLFSRTLGFIFFVGELKYLFFNYLLKCWILVFMILINDLNFFVS